MVEKKGNRYSAPKITLHSELPTIARAAPRKHLGGQIIDHNGNAIADTVQCVHCMAHFVWVVGSGEERGFCKECFGYICGRKCAKVCMHWRKKYGIDR